MRTTLRRVFLGAGVVGVLAFSTACSTIVGKMAEAQLNFQSAPPSVAPIRAQAASNDEVLFWVDLLESSVGEFESIKGRPVSGEEREAIIERGREGMDATLRQNRQLRQGAVGASGVQKTYSKLVKRLEDTEYYHATVSLPEAEKNYIQYMPPAYIGTPNLSKSAALSFVIPVDSMQESIEVSEHFVGLFRTMLQGSDAWKIFDSATQRAEAQQSLQMMQESDQYITDPEVRKTRESTKQLMRERASIEHASSQTFTYKWVDENSPTMVSSVAANVKLPYQVVFTVNNLMLADVDPASSGKTYPEVVITVMKVTPLKSSVSR